GGIDAGGQKAKGGRSHQHLLEKLHGIPHTGLPRLGTLMMALRCVLGYSFPSVTSSVLYIMEFF
ncbi:hypothetical protein, partial [Synechococcus sp. N5]|uniref:hypothetical protein n=1 Tax=Synechococcus sp. N5 TaxID=2575515 RepID=UPI001A7E1917